MKTLIQLVIVLFITIQLNSQEKHVETESVTLENLFTFIVDHFEDDGNPQNITFLLKTHSGSFSNEDKFILKQTFKLLSKRLTEDDFISIATYNHYSGIALAKTPATHLKKMLYAVEHPKESIEAFAKDGIEFAYKYADVNFEEDYDNKVIMIRLPERKVLGNNSVKPSLATVATATTKQKGNGTAIVLSALALLPEIIQVIKD
ncbi:hypothetical protein DFQ05_0552 [Winogradskyella wandonensis]|uniref:VWFA domain-containing protein n=1 Tax=Winogradskyella wandonensis TaxID=1442586 RepID=A0A4V2PU43_9FLAO|nr:hypothetical protein [Winogradskyella wandonensis]TCK69041.1 hypothetical protein DFQ05_0552 [Winogradskyella wandonensis]